MFFGCRFAFLAQFIAINQHRCFNSFFTLAREVDLFCVMMPHSLGMKAKVLMVWLFILTNSLLIAGASKGARSFSAKEAEASAIIYALRRAEELGLFKIHVVSEERSAINGAEDWSIGSFMEDIEGAL